MPPFQLCCQLQLLHASFLRQLSATSCLYYSGTPSSLLILGSQVPQQHVLPSASACRGQPPLSFSLRVASLFPLHSLSPQLMKSSLAPSRKSHLVGSHILCNGLVLPRSFHWVIFFFPSAAYQFWHLRVNRKPSLLFFFQASKIHPSSILEHARALNPESQSMPPYQQILPGISLVVQWFRLCVSIAGGVGSIPSWETKILHASQAQPKTNKSSSKFRSPPGSGLSRHAVLLLTSSYQQSLTASLVEKSLFPLVETAIPKSGMVTQSSTLIQWLGE